jgi:sugar phosphate isomerase/epimerase
MAWELSAFADEAGRSCDEQIAALKQAGLNFIDIRNIDGHNITALPLEQAKVIREKLDEAGIQVGMYGSPLGKIDLADHFKTELAKLQHLGALRPILGGNAVRIFSYYNRSLKWPAAEFRRRALKRLKQLKAMAKDLGLVLFHENESEIFGDKVEDVLTITEELRDAPSTPGGAVFRMIFDFGNYNAGRENAWENWLKLRDTTDAIHLKDNERTFEGKLHHVPVGLGQGCVKQIMTDAVRRNWDGPLVVEPHLSYSAAVVATGPSGVPNQEYGKMTTNESFQIACQAAKDLIAAVGGKAV